MRLLFAWWLVLVLGLLGQTTLLPNLLASAWRPDVTLPLVLWLGLTGTPRGGPLLAFAAGLVLDLVSGAPLGFGGLQRLLVFTLATPFRGVFFADHPLLLVPFAILAAVTDAVLAGLLSRFAFPTPLEAGVLFSIAWRQSLINVLWVPAVFLVLELTAGRQARHKVTV